MVDKQNEIKQSLELKTKHHEVFRDIRDFTIGTGILGSLCLGMILIGKIAERAQELDRPGPIYESRIEDSRRGYVLVEINPFTSTYLLDTNRDGKADLYIFDCNTPKGRVHYQRLSTDEEQIEYSKVYLEMTKERQNEK